MAKKDRIAIIKKIQKIRKTHLISYVTSTREGLEVQMAMDSVRRIYEHLKRLSKTKKQPDIDLFLHSNGGDGTVPWRLVTLIREYAQKFSVLVPYRAFSAATLAALGADEVLMHPMGMLGPTDPTVTNPFNPPDPSNPSQRLGISVEDVTAYIALINDDAGIKHEEEVVQAFNILADKVHPLALGNVKRSLSQSRMMARKLLALHKDMNKEPHKIDEIVDNLTSKLYFHGHPINRYEAKEEVGLDSVQFPSTEVEDLMWSLYADYEEEMKLEKPFRPANEFVAQFPNLKPNEQALTPVATAKMAFIESTDRTDVFSMDYQLSGQKQPNGSTTTTNIILRQSWETE